MNHKLINFAASELKSSLQNIFNKMKRLPRGWEKIFVNLFLIRTYMWCITRTPQTQKLENNSYKMPKDCIDIELKKKNDRQVSP